MPIARTFCQLDDQIVREHTLRFVNRILTETGSAPATELLPGKRGIPGACVVSMTLNVASGILPTYMAEREIHLHEAGPEGDGSYGMSQQDEHDANERLFIARWGVVIAGRGGKQWVVSDIVREFLIRFDHEGSFPDLALFTDEENEELLRMIDEREAAIA